ncbi:MAG: amidohydrolase family protein [Halioglobus sp.]|nr:amidohydrolase family protein [Halioglobus sp.]
MPHDLVIRNAVIVDGGGGGLIDGDLAVKDGIIAHVGGPCAGTGLEEFDARGAVVSPGFIDPHTHLDANLFWDADLTPSSSFGVTTVVAANCGYGFAPVTDQACREYVVRAMSAVEQIPEDAIRESVPFSWSDLRSYFRVLDTLPVLLNHVHLVPHVPLRSSVLGVPDAYQREATDNELDTMAGLLQEGLELGALGFSTDQVVGNPGPGGDLLPGQVCERKELLRFAQVLGEGPGPGLFTMANAALLQDRLAQAEDLEWHLALARRSGRPVVIGAVLDALDDPGAACALMDRILERREPGVTVVPQISTRPFELWTRLDAPGVLVRCLPTLSNAVRSGGAEAVRALAIDAATREKLRLEGLNIAPSPIFSGRWDHVFVRFTLQAGDWRRSVGDIAHERGLAPTDLLLDIALADEFQTQFAIVMRNADDEELGRMVSHPAAMIGASDAGAHILSNTDSCYAVWTLQHWVRERKVLGLEQAVAMLTGAQAQLLGLNDRGFLREGLVADLVVFDPDNVGSAGVRFVDDQPAGGRRLVTEASGVLLSVVNGIIATRDGQSTGARPGQRLRPAGRNCRGV